MVLRSRKGTANAFAYIQGQPQIGRVADPQSPKPESMKRAQESLYWGVLVKIMVPFLGTLNIRCRIIMGIQKP